MGDLTNVNRKSHLTVNDVSDISQRVAQFRSTCQTSSGVPAPEAQSLDVPHLSVPWRSFICTRAARLATIDFSDGEGLRRDSWNYGRIKIPISRLPVSNLSALMMMNRKGGSSQSRSGIVSFLSPSAANPNSTTAAPLPEVVLHESTLIFAAPLRSLFHSWFDVAVPAAWLFLNYLNGSFFLGRNNGSLIHEVSVVFIKGLPQSHSAVDEGVRITTEFLSSGREFVRNQSQVEGDEQRVHCYCGGVLLGNGVLTSTGANQDPVREAATRWAVSELLRFNNLLPLGTPLPIPKSEYGRYGLFVGNRLGDSSTRLKSILESSPRMLILLRRKTRLIGDVAHIIALAEDVGFNVEALYPEDLPTVVQLHTARYADILVGIHGMALTWLLAMDGFSRPNCRRVIELRYYGRKLKGYHNVYHTMASNSQLGYESWTAVDAAFDPTKVFNPAAEKAQLRKKSFPHQLPGFMHQTAYYNLKEAKIRFQSHFESLQHCLREP